VFQGRRNSANVIKLGILGWRDYPGLPSSAHIIIEVLRMKWTLILHHIQKSTPKWIKDLNTRPETTQLLEENGKSSTTLVCAIIFFT
jgi:hypothetical protein